MIIKENAIAHYGTPRHSGRYPWGSGGEDIGRHADFLSSVDDLRRSGMADTDIAKALGMTTTEFRDRKSIAVNAKRAAQQTQAKRLKATGMSATKIGEEMKINESSVRALLAASETNKVDRLHNLANVLRDSVDKKEIIDVGVGVEHFLGVTRSHLQVALQLLKEEGYLVWQMKIPQLGTTHDTQYKVLVKPGVTSRDAFMMRDKIKLPVAYTKDDGDTYEGLKPPLSVSSKRVQVVYNGEGGEKADGMIYIRPGAKDLSMGKSTYAQVRIAVDDTHYIKGMAVYKNDLPRGVDIQFNTSKDRTDNKLDALKKMNTLPNGKVDVDNPFTSAIRRQQGALNILNEEGTWETWKKDFSSQFLSKQTDKLAREQLDMTYETRKKQLSEIRSLTNPTLRRNLLEQFADETDSAAVHLKAAGLPRTLSHVILPLNKIKEDEIYAPNYDNGDRVVLIRHPHGGRFELPELTVNNRNAEGKKTLGVTKDAVGIHAKVAEKLSGADFDGDTVLVVRNNSGKVKTKSTLTELKDFNPRDTYKKYPGMKVLSDDDKQREMGSVSNLITDMTLKGASNREIAQAVRHSMVVIDAAKHELNYKQSEIDHGIPGLRKKWQGKASGGASTLISKAKSPLYVNDRKQLVKVNPRTGEKIYTDSGRTYVNAKGERVPKKNKVPLLSETKDARKLSSGTPMEELYANHSNKLKAMALEARKEAVNTKGLVYDPTANKAYAKEVASLKSKLINSQRNAPIERQAQLVGNAMVRLRRQSNPDLDKEQVRNIKSEELKRARAAVGARKKEIEIDDNEWAAIQAGAITNSMLKQILLHADGEDIKKRAMPKTPVLMTSSKVTRARSMLASGYTQAEVAAHLGVSLTTLKTAI